jgi:glycosyltransferase involved in cell wall biosynthesis
MRGYVRFTLEAMIAQTIRPKEWLFVDDGSTDDTRTIIEGYAAKHSWIHVVGRADRGYRKLGSGVIRFPPPASEFHGLRIHRKA